MKKKLKGFDVKFYISKDGIVNFAKIISGFSLFVSTSTGTYHLASMVSTPTLTFFADTLFASAKRWKSIGDEKKQTHYMLPQDLDKRKEILEEVKKRLASF
jgi:ADP-heptose:LPS heptosyltransferase